ncbi:ER membrane protein complex subunit 7 homolog [Atheta coriaria]|uniref:ER membrane protein complex subunit 7 homolog n=1 Tax=Dalotia coriaria TaxID=877792 RepID=UPI0031F45AB8
MLRFKAFFLLICITSVLCEPMTLEEDSNPNTKHTIEGRIIMDAMFASPNWAANTRIHVNGGEYLGFVKEDGSFLIHNIPTGSYIIEALSPHLTYEPVRVEINSKGKFRARRVNHIQTALVIQVPYPLRMKPLGMTKYFQLREQWMITDFLFNPMILMMVLPLLLIMVLPKMMNDPETKKELEQIGNMTKFEMPQMGDMVTNFLAGGGPQGTQQAGTQKKNAKAKKRQ